MYQQSQPTSKIDRALDSPKDAMEFLKITDGTAPPDFDTEDPDDGRGGPDNPDPEGDGEAGEEEERRGELEIAKALMKANPETAFGLIWVKSAIHRARMRLLEKAKAGNVPVPGTSPQTVMPDPVHVFNSLYVEETESGPAYNFSGKGMKAVDPASEAPELEAGRCRFAGRGGRLGEGDVLLARTPCLHEREVAKLRNLGAETDPGRAWLYEHLNDVLIINNKDDTARRCGGMDFDGDKAQVVTGDGIVRLFEKKPSILVINNEPPKPEKKPLDEFVASEAVRKNMAPSLIEACAVAAAMARELANDFGSGGAALEALVKHLSDSRAEHLAKLPESDFRHGGNALMGVAKGYGGLEFRLAAAAPGARRAGLRKYLRAEALPVLERYSAWLAWQAAAIIDAVKTGEEPQFKKDLLGWVSACRPAGEKLEAPAASGSPKARPAKAPDGRTDMAVRDEPFPGFGEHVFRMSSLPDTLRGFVHAESGAFLEQVKAAFEPEEAVRKGREKEFGNTKGGLGDRHRTEQKNAIRLLLAALPDGMRDEGLLDKLTKAAVPIAAEYARRADGLPPKPPPARGHRTRREAAADKAKTRRYYRALDRLNRDAKKSINGLLDGPETARRAMAAIALIRAFPGRSASGLAYRTLADVLEETLAAARQNGKYGLTRKIPLGRTAAPVPETADRLTVRGGMARAGGGGFFAAEGLAGVPDGEYAPARGEGGISIAVPADEWLPENNRAPARFRERGGIRIEFAPGADAGHPALSRERGGEWETSLRLGTWHLKKDKGRENPLVCVDIWARRRGGPPPGARLGTVSPFGSAGKMSALAAFAAANPGARCRLARKEYKDGNGQIQA